MFWLLKSLFLEDGTGFASKCSSTDLPAAPALGPQLPLPLIYQNGQKTSVIVDQPTDLVPLTRNFSLEIERFVREEASEPFFLYVAFGHVHTATPNILPDEQYAGCPFVNSTGFSCFLCSLSLVFTFALG